MLEISLIYAYTHIKLLPWNPMLIDDIREHLKSVEPDLATITAYWENAAIEKRFQELHSLSETESFWQHPKQAEILKELQRLRVLRDHYLTVTKNKEELAELAELFQSDEQELTKIS